ncbi:piwi-like protein Siwi [Lycorma delicatula]|uniref:piwi-like protein Siwi n=1 Tax=Lycorma delicatula TaxID=130591 RepID=UPI003F50DC8C
MSEGTGRGRARGRAAARGQQPQQQMQTTGRAVTRTQAPVGGPGAAGSGGPPPGGRVGAAGGSKPPPPGFQRQQQQQQQPLPSHGRAAHRGAGGGDTAASLHTKFARMQVQDEGKEGAAGGNSRQIGRGASRGRREIGVPSTEIIKTKPDSCLSKIGTSGNVIRLTANYFRILTKPDYTLYQYRVDFKPEEDRTAVKRALMKIHQKQIGPGYIFDGTLLYTFRRLYPNPLELYSKRDHDDVNIQIIIKLVGDIRHGDYHYLQIYNIIIKKCLRNLNLQLLNRNYFDREARMQIPEYQLEVWPGYLTSMRQHDGGILLCTEIVHKVIRRDNAHVVLAQITRKDSRKYKEMFQAEIVGQVVLTTYGNPKTYRVDDVDFQATPLSTFDYKGQQVTYVDYYKNKYGVTIINKQQPMIVSLSKARDIRAGQESQIYLVPELCQMTGITDEMRANNVLMKSMADHTRLNAEARQRKLLQFNERFHSVKENIEELQNWQLQLDKNLVQFEARRLPPEKIIQGNNVAYLAENVDWTNQLRSNPLLVTGVLDHWVVVTLKRSVRDTQGFVQLIQKAGNGMSFRIGQPRIEEIMDDRAGSVIEALDRILARDVPKLVMCVVSNNRADRYNAIKKKTNVDRPVPSQVLCAKTMTRKGAMSIATKVAIQLSCKIGGAPWSVDLPLQGLMVVGYDVCHDSQSKAKSFGAMVASLNKPLSRYFSTVTHHSSGEEVFNDLALNIGKAIHKFSQVNSSLPSKIIIYRDGVGEGQLHTVMKQEIQAVTSAVKELYKGEEAKLAFIIVTKRLNTRLFFGRNNPPAGTVVDDCITHPEKYDFFLVSQSVRQGSVSPTGYNVVYDTSGLTPDKMQRLSYKMTHMYYNWSGTVRVPAPCQYAHKLAFLVGQNIHRTPNTELENLLYFL